MKKKLAAILLGMMMPAMLFSTNVSAVGGTTVSDNYNVEYKTHVQDYGWETIWKSNGDLAGTVGESKRLEALRVKLTGSDLPAGATIQTYVHVQNEGDLGPFSMGSVAGTEGKSQRLERVTLNLINLPDRQLRYNVQVQNIGWLRDENDESTWFVGGEAAGTSGKGYRLEGIKIVLVETNDAYAAYQKALAAVREEDYTSLSWIYYQADVEANAVTEADDKETILAATEAILEAQKSLVKGSDLSAYNQALASVNEVDYTPESWESYQDVVWNNYVTKDDSQAIVTAATKKIVEAQKSLQRKVNLTRYNELLAGVLESDYLPDSWAEYLQVLADNVVTAANTQTAINEAVKNIEAAQKKMVRRLDFSGYKSLLSAVKEADYTVESWATYQDVVDANLMTENNTQSQIEKAMANIAAAQNNLIKAADLSAYEAALAAVNESDYTPATWLVYQNVVKTNKVTAASGQAAIDAATEKIVAAQLKLVDKADFTAYETALAAVNQNDYTPLSWMAYQKVVTANRASAAAAQDAVDKATDKILAAQLNLVLKGNLTNYKNALEAVKAVNYTTASWSEYQKVVKANVVTTNSLQSAIDLATENIIAAQENLEFKGGDLRAYDAALAKVKQADFTIVSWKAYQKVVEANVVTGENKQTEIDQATKNVQAAQSALVKKSDLTSYNIALAGLDETEYTAASWKAYQSVVKANVRTAEDTQAVIDLSTTKILAAQQSLVKVGDLTAYNAVLAKVRKENYTTASWNAYQLVVRANVRTNTNTQLLIDDAVKKIAAAQKLLVRKYDVSAYNALLAAVKQADYIPASWTAYQTVVKAYPASYSPIQTAIEKIEAAQAKLVKKVDLTAYKKALAAVKEAEYVPATWVAYMKVVNANVVDETNTQTQIDEATKKIIEAQKNLKRKVNLTLYLELLEGVIEYDYSPTSWVIYQKVLADNVVTENNTQTEVDAATEKIRVAQNKLVRRLDYTRYQQLVDAMKDKEDLYTSVSWGLYDKVIKDNTLKKDQSETQTQIDKAVANIEAAQKKLVKAGDLTAYNLVLKAATIENYTSASWAVYLKVLEANEMTKNHSQAEIDAATDKIRLAQLKLAGAGDIAEYTKLTTDMKADKYTSVSWAIYQKVIDANFVSAADGQTKINAAVAKLSEASRKLVPRVSDEDYAEYTRVLNYNFQRTDPLSTDPDKLRKMDEKEYTTSSWTVYQKVLDANYMDRDKSLAQVKAAVVNIKKAQFKLLVGGDLGRYNNLLKYNVILGKDPDVLKDTRVLKDMKETDYTSTSWTVYAKVLSSNEMDRDKSQAQIDAAVVKIERAQQKLVEKGDLDLGLDIPAGKYSYNYLMAYNVVNKNNVTGVIEIIPMKEADYTEKTWTFYEKLLKSKGYLVTANNSQAEIARAVDLIKAAQRDLKKIGNLATYYDVKSDEYFTNQDNFKTKPWEVYLSVLKANVVNTETPQSKIDTAVQNILDAQKILGSDVNKATPITMYTDALKATDVASAYTQKSWDAYQDVVRKYVNISKDSSKTEVADAAKAITLAQKDLVYVNDIELLAFKKALDLYQQNLRVKDSIKKLIVESTDPNIPSTWDNYAKAVDTYASFNPLTGDWIANKIDGNDEPEVIKAATQEIELMIRRLVPADPPLNDAYVDYMETIKDSKQVAQWMNFDDYWGNKDVYETADLYTASSFKTYVDKVSKIEIVNFIQSKPGTSMKPVEITSAKNQILGIQVGLIKRATPTELDNLKKELSAFDNLIESNFTKKTWAPYVAAWMSNNYDFSKPEEIDSDGCVNLTDSLSTKKAALTYKSEYVLGKTDITVGKLTPTSIKVGENVLEKAKTLITAAGYDVAKYEIGIERTGGDDILATGGQVTGAGTVKFKITLVASDDNSDIKAYTNELTLSITQAAADAVTAQAAIDAIAAPATPVTADITLPITSNTQTVTWSSNNAAIAVAGEDATVTRPVYAAGDTSVTLTASVTVGASTITKNFTVVVTKLPSAIATVKAIAVPTHGTVVKDLTSVITVNASTGTELLTDLESTDGSTQTYAFTDSYDASKLTTAALADGDKLVVTPANGTTTTKTYTIDVN